MAVQRRVGQIQGEAQDNKHHLYTVEAPSGVHCLEVDQEGPETGVVGWYSENIWLHLVACVALEMSFGHAALYLELSHHSSSVLEFVG